MIATFVLLGLFAAALVYFILIYNNLVRLRENIRRNWSNIDVLLKQRHDELPKLVDTCREYMRYEQATLEKVMKARNAVSEAQGLGDIAGLGAAETMLRSGLGRLFAVVEAYPELKANESFQHLQGRITGLEESIADRREYYNESVNSLNIRIDQFPDIVVARLFDFTRRVLLEFTEEELSDVEVGARFAAGRAATPVDTAPRA